MKAPKKADLVRELKNANELVDVLDRQFKAAVGAAKVMTEAFLKATAERDEARTQVIELRIQAAELALSNPEARKPRPAPKSRAQLRREAKRWLIKLPDGFNRYGWPARPRTARWAR
jgi:hypothetical protein